MSEATARRNDCAKEAKAGGGSSGHGKLQGWQLATGEADVSHDGWEHHGHPWTLKR